MTPTDLPIPVMPDPIRHPAGERPRAGDSFVRGEKSLSPRGRAVAGSRLKAGMTGASVSAAVPLTNRICDLALPVQDRDFVSSPTMGRGEGDAEAAARPLPMVGEEAISAS